MGHNIFNLKNLFADYIRFSIYHNTLENQENLFGKQIDMIKEIGHISHDAGERR
jgi:hypothetical protein